MCRDLKLSLNLKYYENICLYMYEQVYAILQLYKTLKKIR